MLKMDLEYNQGILFVRLDGELNRMTSYKVNNYLVPVILKHKIKYLIYNFYNLKDIDDCGVDALLNTKSAVKMNKGIIRLCEVDKQLNRKLNKIRIKKIDDELVALRTIEV